MKKYTQRWMRSLLLLSALLSTVAYAQERVPSKVGDIVVHSDFKSQLLGNSRNITVYLPPGYATETKQRFKVFYMGDGQNVFDGMTSFIPNKEWRMDETAQDLIARKEIVPIIIVGIDNAGTARADEYLPTRAKFNGSEGGGNADAFVKFVTDELKPFIDKTYRTKKGPKDTAIGGSSFGGIMALHAALTRPDVFGGAAVVSPSVWWDGRVMVKRVAALRKNPKVRIWLDIGSSEGSRSVQDTLALFDALIERGWTRGDDLEFTIAKDAVHNEDAWAARTPAILKFLFPRK